MSRMVSGWVLTDPACTTADDWSKVYHHSVATFAKHYNRDGSISWRIRVVDGHGRGAYRASRTVRVWRDTKTPPKKVLQIAAELEEQARGGFVTPQQLRVSVAYVHVL